MISRGTGRSEKSRTVRLLRISSRKARARRRISFSGKARYCGRGIMGAGAMEMGSVRSEGGDAKEAPVQRYEGLGGPGFGQDAGWRHIQGFGEEADVHQRHHVGVGELDP